MILDLLVTLKINDTPLSAIFYTTCSCLLLTFSETLTLFDYFHI